MSTELELWTTTDVAAYLGVKPATVSAYRHRGQMPAPLRTLGERTHLWDAETIRAWKACRPTGRASAARAPSPPPRIDPHEWLVHGERALYESEWVSLSLVDVEPPFGGRFEHHVVTIPAAAMTAIIDGSNENVGLIWRHRFAADVWNWELPGGLVDDGEEPEVAARREVTEELGIELHTLRHLVTFEPMIGMVRCPHHVYVATGGEVVNQPIERNEGEGLATQCPVPQ